MNPFTDAIAKTVQHTVVNICDDDGVVSGVLAAGVIQEVAIPDGTEIIVNGSAGTIWFTVGPAPVDPEVPNGAVSADHATHRLYDSFNFAYPTEGIKMKLIASADTVVYFECRTR